MKTKKAMSTPLTFGELSVGDLFIDFPSDGDDSGHGGYRKGSYVFKKISPVRTDFPNHFYNEERLMDGIKSHAPDAMLVYKVYC